MSKTAIMGAAAIAALIAGTTPGEATRLVENIPIATRSAPIENVNEETRTVRLVWTTGAQVQRYDWWEGKRFLEELSLDDGAVDLTRLNDGAPLLNSHGMYDLSSQIGVVERAWIENGQGYAEVRFPQAGISEDADRVFQLVKDRIIRNVSVGYRVDKYQITDNQGDGLDIWRAVKWQPMEISLVTVPADAGAGVRSEQPTHACEFIGRSKPATTTTETEMSKTENAERHGGRDPRRRNQECR
jgi:HK97 family phage prohead protease